MPGCFKAKLGNFAQRVRVVALRGKMHLCELDRPRARCLVDPRKGDLDGVGQYAQALHVLDEVPGGIGLERLIMVLTGTENIRDTTFYPRDVDRLTP